jgi:hypothetical protein
MSNCEIVVSHIEFLCLGCVVVLFAGIWEVIKAGSVKAEKVY